MERNKQTKIQTRPSSIKKVQIFISILLIVLAVSISSYASTLQTPNEVSKTFDGVMPQRSITGSTGMFPQYFSGTSVSSVDLQDSRLNWKTNSWQATANGQVAYCGAFGYPVRYGVFETAKHYLRPDGTTIQGMTFYPNADFGGTIRQQVDAKYMQARQTAISLIPENAAYYTGISNDGTKYEGTEKSTIRVKGPTYTNISDIDTIGYVLNDDNKGTEGYKQMIGAAEANSQQNMQLFFNELQQGIWPGHYSKDLDPDYDIPTITGTQGAEILVVETNDKTTDGYKKTGFESYSNDKKAFIFTSAEGAYNNSSNNTSYSLNDIQTAYWKVLAEEGGKQPCERITENGLELYEKANQYADFVSEIGGGYQASIDTSLAQVIADRTKKEYIIGPLVLNYPMYEDISYVKSINLNEDENLLYDETHSGIEIILDKGEGSGTIGSNGLQKEYPQAGQKFFIKFSAEKAGYPTSVTINARFEYISSTSASATTYTAKANTYKYYGYCLIDEKDYNMNQGKVSWEFSYEKGKSERVYDYATEQWMTKYSNERVTISSSDYIIYQPYFQLGEDAVNGQQAQPVPVLENNRIRTYDVAKTSAKIDLSMELGGYVWVDEDGGKESISNGTYESSEKRVPNVKVTLSDGQTTQTNSNGEYKFKGLNAMKTYSVTFTYNGQYYQPTTWSPANTWGTSSWRTNSNAKDDNGQRESFNIKFASIGSSPENYESSVQSGTKNRTYSKEELIKAGAIDEFGNNIGGGNQSMQLYVQDCMMKAYTFDAYPYPSVFVIDSKPVTHDYVRCFKSQPAILYNNAYYINLGLNPREESDLAIKKDVDHVTLEINGQTHTYTYDTLENKENAEKEWDINVRLSDAYYNAAYSRELYKSDYLYKASMYGDEQKQKEFGKSKEDELEVYITYKIMVRNQSMSIRAKINELVDYYDEDLEYIDNRSYIQIKQNRDNALQKGIYSVGASNKSIYADRTTTDIAGYDNLYITGLAKTSKDDKQNYLAAGQTAYIYLTFKVKKEARDGEDWVKLDEQLESGEAIGVGKENIIEVNGYSTQYAQGTQVPNVGDVSFKPAGIVDKDSNPGNVADTGIKKDNANLSVFEKFEDDTDKAPNLRIILYRDDNTTRVISGTVWEDERNDTIGVTTTGDGIREENNTLINGVTVQLVELMENGTEYVWREFGDNIAKEGELGGQTTLGKGSGTGTVTSETPIINAYNLVENYNFAEEHNGQYAFKSFMPGKYVVRFIYGDTIKTVTPASLNMGGLNEKSYNGQDYKSTTYQQGVEQHVKDEQGNVSDKNKTYTWRETSTWGTEKPGQETLGKILTEVATMKNDASNNETTQLPQRDAQGNFETIPQENQKGYLYDITESEKYNGSSKNYPLVSDAKDIESRRNDVNNYSDDNVTNYIAEVLASHKNDYTTMNNREQLLNDLMQNTKMTAETGLMVIELEYDATGTDGNNKENQYKIQNVDLGLEERPKAQLVIDKQVTNVKLTLADGSILFDAKNTATNVLWRDHKAYNLGYKGNLLDESKFGNLQNIRNKNANKFGLIQLTMDEELMHGATIEITYQISLTNVGEVDYHDNLFYYTGNKSQNAPVVTTRADQVLDYVANNLQFNASNNANWVLIEKQEIQNQGLVNSSLKEQVDKYNTVIVTEALKADLVPSLYKEKEDKTRQDSVSVPLVLTQLITAENDTDDLTYRNLVEIVKTSNTVGRRMEYSVVGNQDPTKEPQELDSDRAEVVRILPPFGTTTNIIILATLAVAVIAIMVGGIIFIKKKVLRK